jgi:hypothetical protein
VTITREKLVLSAVLALAFACRLDKLLETPRPPGLGVAPSRVAESADSGSGDRRTVALTVSSTPSRVISWTAHSEADSDWLALDNTSGSTPDTLRFTLTPGDRPPGTYRDAIIVVPDDSTAPSVRVPVELRINPVSSTTGNLSVRVGTTGPTPDPDGYNVTLDGDSSHTVGLNDTTVYSGLAPRSYTVQLDDVALNCTVTGGATRSGVAVSAGQTATVTFAVNCPTTPPPTGDLKVRATTTGATPDPDGYTVTIDGGQSRTISNNDSTTYTLAAATYTVLLGDIESNCTVSNGPSSRTVSVTAGQTRTEPFAVDCPSPPATRLLFSVQPRTTTAGATITPAVQVRAADAQGNTNTTFTGNVRLDIRDNPGAGTLAGNANASAVSGVATFPGLSIDKAGSPYTLAAHASGLGDGVSAEFAINPGPPDHLVFTVQPSDAQANRPIAPAVQVTMMDLNGNVATSFTSTVFMGIDNDGALVPPATLSPPGTQRAAAAGVATFEDLRIDKVGVGYTLVASAAGYKGGYSGSFDVTPATPSTGDLTVGASTSGGTPDPNGYTITVDGGSSRTITNNGSTTYTGVTSGDHSVELTGLASNCTTSGANPRSVTVPAGSSASSTFAVDCPAPPPPPATHLAFSTQPPNPIILSTTFSVAVTALNAQGGIATGFTGTVQLTLQGPIAVGGLQGTTQVNAAGGVARFTNLQVTGVCVGCSLVANASGLGGATSRIFNVVVGQ